MNRCIECYERFTKHKIPVDKIVIKTNEVILKMQKILGYDKSKTQSYLQTCFALLNNDCMDKIKHKTKNV